MDGLGLHDEFPPFGIPRNERASATGAVKITLPIAAIAMAYILGQAAVDTWGE